MARRNADGGGPKKKVVYVKTRGGKVINTSASGLKPTPPRVAAPTGNVGVGGKAKAKVRLKPNPRTAADSKPTPKGGRVGHKNARGVGFRPGNAARAINEIMKAVAPPGVQSADRPRVDITKGNLKSHPAPKGAKQSVAGFSPDVTKSAKVAKNLAAIVPASTAVTAYHQPGKTAGDTAKSVVSIPAGLIRAAVNPKDSAAGIVKDYSRRYDAAAKGDYKKFHERQMKEGAAPELFDIATVATAGGATTGRVAQKAAESGKLGKGAERVATKTTKVRLSGGDHVEVRRPSKNFYKNAANAARHNVRARVQVRRAAKPQAAAIVREAMGSAGDPAVLKSIARHNRKVAKRAAPATPKTKTRVGRPASTQLVRTGETRVGASGTPPAQRTAADEKLLDRYFRGEDMSAVKRARARELIQADKTPPDAYEPGVLVRTYRAEHRPEVVRRETLTPPSQRHPASEKATRRVLRQHVEEVTPVRGRKAKRAQVRAVAHEGGVTLQRMKAEQQREVLGKTGVRGTIRNLSKDEQAAYKYQAQYAPRSAADAKKILIRHRDRIKAERAKNPVRSVVDELPVLDHLIKNADQAFTDNLRAAVKTEGNRSRRLAAGDPGVNMDQALRRAHMPAGDLLGVKPVEGETAVQYARRVRQAGQQHGLGAPAYFKSEEIPRGVRHMFAKGGSRAVRGPGVYTGALTKTGRESGDVQIAVRAAAENIKRKFNWNHVADTVDQHVFPWSREKNYSAYELEKELIRRGIDPQSVRLWNPRLMREQQHAIGEHAVDGDPSFSSATVGDALKHATADPGSLALNQAQFKTTGWQVAPKHVIDEVTDTATAGRAEGKVARGYDISKGQVSRVLLANPAWLGFQVGSNTLMTGLAGVTPADLVRSVRFYRGLNAAQRADHEAVFGVHGWFKDQRRMGAAGGSMTRAWEAVKDTPFYRRGLEGHSPLDALFFRPDNAQNNFFRRAVMYNRLKRETYRQMGKDATAMVKLQQRITGMLKGPPEEQMRAFAANKKVVEQYAQHVDDFLGNWTRYTAKERHVFSRFVMFYGFLRFATRLAFYTMPVKHPIMSSILLQIGRLEKDEITRIFGTEPPPWEVGNLYAPGTAWGQGASKGQADVRIPTTRLVPFFNALQYAAPDDKSVIKPYAAIGMLNPVAGILLNQAGGKNMALDQPYTVGGKTAYVIHSGDLSLKDRLHLVTAEALHLSPWDRAVEAAVLRGKQGSDSSLLFPRPVKYKGTTTNSAVAKARNDKLIAEQNANGPLNQAAQVLLPQLGTDGNRRITSAQQWAKTEAARKNKKKAGRARSNRNGLNLGGSTGGGYDLSGGTTRGYDLGN